VERIYLDHAATTPVRPEVVEAMTRYMKGDYGNASSSHAWGRAARVALEEARERVAAVLGAKRSEILFTTGGTESNNLAVMGWFRRARIDMPGTIPTVCCSAIEHKSVIGPVEAAGREGAHVAFLPVDTTGVVDVESLDRVPAAGPALVSVHWGNNEIGTLQPVADLAERVQARGGTFHTDAVQAFGHVEVRVDRVPCDMLTMSGHKFGGPIGVGILFVRSGVKIEPLLHGGGQESGLRPGTSNVAGAVGFATAVDLAARERETVAARLEALRGELEAMVSSRVPDVTIPGSAAARLPHVTNFIIPGADREMLLMALDFEGVAASGGSACQSGAVEPSHVIAALGYDLAGAATLRLSLGRTTTAEEVHAAAERICRVIENIRAAAH